MNHLLKPIMGGLSRRAPSTPVAGFNTSGRLFAQSESKFGKDVKKENTMFMIIAGAVLGGLGLLYFYPSSHDASSEEAKGQNK